MKILQINSVANIGSTGRIAEQIGQAAMDAGWESYIAYGREAGPSQSRLIKIGSQLDVAWHGVVTRLFDRHGLASRRATRIFISQVKKIQPDIIHLHNIHGYYLNYQILFDYLAKADIPVVWTLHDCWAMTGHCAYFDFIGCRKWMTGCEKCPNLASYPQSYIFDNSRLNYQIKKKLFSSIKNMTIVPVSYWMREIVNNSYLKANIVYPITNGIDLEKFQRQDMQEIITLKNRLGLKNEIVILGVASIWDSRKGLNDFIKLSSLIPNEWKIILVGLNKKQINSLPRNIIGIQRTENIQQLATLYSMSSVFVNPTYEDTYPTTNLEAISCGTPVVTYNTGGSPESVKETVGIVVDKGDLSGLVKAIGRIVDNGYNTYKEICREYAETFFDREKKFKEYINLYNKILNNDK